MSVGVALGVGPRDPPAALLGQSRVSRGPAVPVFCPDPLRLRPLGVGKNYTVAPSDHGTFTGSARNLPEPNPNLVDRAWKSVWRGNCLSKL